MSTPTLRSLAMAWDDITTVEGAEQEPDTWGMFTVTLDGETYAIDTDAAADGAVEQSIKESLWAFRAQFICDYCRLPSALVKAVEAWQAAECEGCNDDIDDMIERAPGGLGGFVEEAVAADGRGHFLATYDGEELEVTTASGTRLYAYRIN